MNCRPGDTAIVVRGDLLPGNIGIIVEVLEKADRPIMLLTTKGPLLYDPPPDSWLCQTLGTSICWRTRICEVYPIDICCFNFAIPDSILKPLRDPGDGAVDEMVLRVGHVRHIEPKQNTLRKSRK